MTFPMTLLFAISLLLIAYSYFGYLACLVLRRRFRGARPTAEPPGDADLPQVSVVMAGHNELARLPAKLANLRELDYPARLLEFVVVSDGSTDGTAATLEEQADWLTPVILPEPVGKAAALNYGVRAATGDILLLCDVRQTIAPDALRALLRHFHDPAVGAVSGELLLEEPDGSPSGEGLGLYWRIEKMIRRLESETGSVVGVTGALYAVRRSLFPVLPAGTLLDDVFVPMAVARTGARVLFEPEAQATDRLFPEPGKEFRRKVRTLTGNYQLLRLQPWLLTPGNPLLFRFLSHKLSRLLVPVLLALLLVSSALAGGPVLFSVFLLQLVFYGVAALGAVRPALRRNRLVGTAYTFCLLNLAAALALGNALRGRTGQWA